MEYQDPKFSEKAVNMFAGRVARRLSSITSVPLGLDDIKQELWCAWCVSRERFDPELGVPFLAFLRRGMALHINRVVDRQVFDEAEFTFALSLNAAAPSCEDGQELIDILPNDEESAFDILARQETVALILDHLDERDVNVVRILIEQPPELMSELRLIEAKREFAKETNSGTNYSNRLTFCVIYDLLGFTRVGRAQSLKRIQETARRYGR